MPTWGCAMVVLAWGLANQVHFWFHPKGHVTFPHLKNFNVLINVFPESSPFNYLPTHLSNQNILGLTIPWIMKVHLCHVVHLVSNTTHEEFWVGCLPKIQTHPYLISQLSLVCPPPFVAFISH
jgi:hypothetical protein